MEPTTENTYRRRTKLRIYLASNENGSDDECRGGGSFEENFLVIPGLHPVWTEENYESPIRIMICNRTEDSTSGECTHLNSCALSDH